MLKLIHDLINKVLNKKIFFILQKNLQIHMYSLYCLKYFQTIFFSRQKIFLFKTIDKDKKITKNNTQPREDLRY